MKTINWGYIAGLLDGEGSIVYPGVHQPLLVISNTSYELMEYLQKTLGGKIYTNRDTRANHKTCYFWRLQKRTEIHIVLTSLLPYLIIKKQQAVIAIKCIEDHANKKNRQKLLCLKHLV